MSKLRREDINPASAEELRQEALIILFTEYDKNKGPPKNVVAFLDKVLVNLICTHGQLARVKAGAGDDAEAVPTLAPDPEQAVGHAELWHKMKGYVGRLSKEEAEVFEAREQSRPDRGCRRPPLRSREPPMPAPTSATRHGAATPPPPRHPAIPRSSSPRHALRHPPAMPTLEHNGLVDLFRDNPALASHLVEILFGLAVPATPPARIADSALDQLIPIEFRADLVLELLGPDGAPVLLVVLEIQRDEDTDKLYAWPVYVAVARSRKRCPAIALVVAPDPKVAAWAAQRIDVGLGLTTMQPLVLGPAAIPSSPTPPQRRRSRSSPSFRPSRTATARTAAPWSRRRSARSPASTPSGRRCTSR